MWEAFTSLLPWNQLLQFHLFGQLGQHGPVNIRQEVLTNATVSTLCIQSLDENIGMYFAMEEMSNRSQESKFTFIGVISQLII